MARQRFVQLNGELVPVSKDWHAEPRADIHIIPDIQPYQAVGVDIATGNAPVIKSRSDHREYLKRNRYVEIGNERLPDPPSRTRGLDSPRAELTRAVRDVLSRRRP